MHQISDLQYFINKIYQNNTSQQSSYCVISSKSLHHFSPPSCPKTPNLSPKNMERFTNLRVILAQSSSRTYIVLSVINQTYDLHYTLAPPRIKQPITATHSQPPAFSSSKVTNRLKVDLHGKQNYGGHFVSNYLSKYPEMVEYIVNMRFFKIVFYPISVGFRLEGTRYLKIQFRDCSLSQM